MTSVKIEEANRVLANAFVEAEVTVGRSQTTTMIQLKQYVNRQKVEGRFWTREQMISLHLPGLLILVYENMVKSM